MTITTRTVSSVDHPIAASLQTLPLPVFPVRRERRDRDFGIGYGSSSGYVSNRRYATNWGAPRFRFA